jgi:tight adherence protein B
MSSFIVIKEYMISFFLILMPVAGMMLIFYSAFTLWKDLRSGEKRKIRERLREEEARRQSKKLDQSIMKQTKSDTSLFERIVRQISLTRKIDKWIVQADMDLTPAQLLTRTLIAVAVVAGVGFFARFGSIITLVLVLLTFCLPVFYIRFRAKRRMKKLVHQLPEVFELVSQALRAGHSLASGIQLIGKQIPDPAGMEFTRIFHEQNLGIKLEEALTNFADRTDQLDIRFFVTAVLIQRQTGGDLAEILDKIGSVIRDRITIMGQVQALTAEGRMSGWVLSAMPFFVFFAAWTMNPDYAGVLIYEKEGQMMLGTAFFFQVLGMLMIKKIVNIKI